MIVNTDKLIITSRYGTRWNSFHKGIDLRTVNLPSWDDFDLSVPEDCKVLRVGRDKYGNYFLVVKPLKNKQFKELKFIHIDDYALSRFKTGDKLKKGDYIGRACLGGNSRAKHLHFEVWMEIDDKLDHTNPLDYLRIIKREYDFK
jgi:murein DD-endopeptidase MepM/ murein hydrolase activator NlpD